MSKALLSNQELSNNAKMQLSRIMPKRKKKANYILDTCILYDFFFQNLIDLSHGYLGASSSIRSRVNCETMQKPRYDISENLWTTLCKGVKESLKGRSEEAALQETPRRKSWSW